MKPYPMSEIVDILDEDDVLLPVSLKDMEKAKEILEKTRDDNPEFLTAVTNSLKIYNDLIEQGRFPIFIVRTSKDQDSYGTDTIYVAEVSKTAFEEFNSMVESQGSALVDNPSQKRVLH